MVVDGFDWDEGNAEKCQKHGLCVSEIESLFMASPLIMVNTKHDMQEERLQAIGRTSTGRYAFVVFTFRQRGKRQLIRPISARYMRDREVRYYEEKIEEHSKV